MAVQGRAVAAGAVDAGAVLAHAAASERPVAPTGSRPDGEAVVGGPDWPALRERVAACRRCALCESRTQTVLGVGPTDARVMVIGEAPGAEEDQRGEPFVGQAGRLLDNMLAAVGLSRERDVYIANVLKCRPPGNRNPQAEEIASCLPYLLRQVHWIGPEVLILVGRFAAQTVLQREGSIASLRGVVHEVAIGGRRIPAVVTYHPAYLLRSLGDKAKAWVDLARARDLLQGRAALSDADLRR